ncbi:hypothetical protein EVAR_77192_1 [Eumeta japonica]|uniref:Uncharacterized protein n=1 Tax=Eumeta variegata TaxID=151549 RepID=A0A4C1T1Z0_EUMVA|nr:hypothetical protein EVAR_77192_1 [Eumeta japonica]
MVKGSKYEVMNRRTGPTARLHQASTYIHRPEKKHTRRHSSFTRNERRREHSGAGIEFLRTQFFVKAPRGVLTRGIRAPLRTGVRAFGSARRRFRHHLL